MPKGVFAQNSVESRRTPLDNALHHYYKRRVILNSYPPLQRLLPLCALLAVLAAYALSWPSFACAQATFLCKDCGSADNSVLVLDAAIPTAALASLAWKTETEQNSHSLTFLLRPGRHAYALGDNPAWRGRISLLVSPEGAPARFVALRPPSIMDSLDTFLAPELISWGQPNVLRRDPKLFGIKYDLLLLAFCPVAAAVAFFLFRRSLRTSLLIGLVLAFLLMDLRTDYGHVRTVRSLDKHFFFSPWRENAQLLENMASSISSAPWCEKKMDWPLSTLAHYKLLSKPRGKGGQCEQWIVVTPERFAVEYAP